MDICMNDSDTEDITETLPSEKPCMEPSNIRELILTHQCVHSAWDVVL